MADTHKDSSVAYVRRILKETGWEPTRLARKAGVAQTTITRPLNNPDHPHGFSSRTLAKVARASGIPLPRELGGTVTAATGTAAEAAGDPVSAPIARDEVRPDVYAYQLLDDVIERLDLHPTREQRAKAFEKASDFVAELLRGHEPKK